MSDQRYVFLIGAARSGTKFLRDTLAASNDVAEIPYDINYVWRHGNENCPHDELRPEDIDAKTAAHIRRSIDRLAMKGRDTRPPIILEKTVSNTLRMDLIRAVFPEAEFIVLERDGRDVVESSYRQWTKPADRSYLIEKLRYFPVREWRYALWFARNLVNRSEQTPIWGPRYDGITTDLGNLGTAQTCAKQWSASVKSSRLMSRDHDTIKVHYGELDTDRGIGSLVSHLVLSDPDAVLAKFEQSFSKISSWPGAIPVPDREACAATVESTG